MDCGLASILPAERITPTAKSDISKLQSVRDAICQTITTSTARFDNVVKPIIAAQHSVEETSGIIHMLRYASPDAATREACSEAVRLYSQCYTDFNARTDIFTLLQAVKSLGESLDKESEKYLNELLDDYRRYGHGTLNEHEIRECAESRMMVDKLCLDFTQNIMDESGAIMFSVSELDGVSEKDLKCFQDAARREDPNAPADQCLVRFNINDLVAILRFAKDPAVRERLYVADSNKLPQNVPIFQEVILLRDSIARKLGYSSHAAYRVSRRMAKTTQWVDKFLEDTEQVLLPRGHEEVAKLCQLRATNESTLPSNFSHNLDTLPPWDASFYKRIARESINVELELLSEYFTLEHTVERMLGLFSQILQMRMQLVTPGTYPTWDPNVSLFAVWDDRPDHGGEFIGHLYMDLYFRPNKHTGCQNVNIRPSYIDVNNERVYPVTLLMCNFAPANPLDSSYTFLQHHQLVSLFHELGHGIHDLVSRTRYSRFHGWKSPPDFAEIPGLLMENWCWLKDELKAMSCHYTYLDEESKRKWHASHPLQSLPPKTVTDALIDPLIDSRNNFRGLELLDRLMLSRFDMEIHNPESRAACMSLDPTVIYNELDERLGLLVIPPGISKGHSHVNFGHLLSGYDAGYYAYLSAEAFARDLFESAFRQNPRDPGVWEEYRRHVLTHGGSGDEFQYLVNFLGRKPSSDALF